MNVLSYLKSKYGKIPTCITRIEANVFGMPYPPSKNWLATYGGIRITDSMAGQLKMLLAKKLAKSDRRAKLLFVRKGKIKLGVARHAELLKVGMGVLGGTRPIFTPVQPAQVVQETTKPVPSQEKQPPTFYESREWKALRYQVLIAYGATCQCCGATRADGVTIHVDHIKPRSLYPALALDFKNMQVLCEPCNIGKSNLDETDWRPAEFA